MTSEPPISIESMAATEGRRKLIVACGPGDSNSILVSVTDNGLGFDEERIDRAVVFTWPFADPRLCAEANDWVAALQRRHPGRVAGCGIIQPADPGAAEELRRCARLGLRGIGELNADAQ